MTEAQKANLHETTDASVWAAEFCKNWPISLCQFEGREGVETEEDFEAIMLGWFANAIMAGVDSEARLREAAVKEAVETERETLLARIKDMTPNFPPDGPLDAEACGYVAGLEMAHREIEARGQDQ